MLIPRIRNVQLEPLYRAEAFGLELSEDVLQTNAYLNWFMQTNYPVQHPTF